jgi:hypothetical protein
MLAGSAVPGGEPLLFEAHEKNLGFSVQLHLRAAIAADGS